MCREFPITPRRCHCVAVVKSYFPAIFRLSYLLTRWAGGVELVGAFAASVSCLVPESHLLVHFGRAERDCGPTGGETPSKEEGITLSWLFPPPRPRIPFPRGTLQQWGSKVGALKNQALVGITDGAVVLC